MPRGAPERLPGRPPSDRSGKASRIPQGAPETAQDSPKRASKRSPNSPMIAQDDPRGPENGPETRPDVLKVVQPSLFGTARQSHRARNGPEPLDGPPTGPLEAQ